MHIKNRWITGVLFCILICCALLLVLTLNKQKQEKEPLNIVYIPKVDDKTNDFSIAVKAGAQMAVKDYEVQLTLLAPKDEKDIEGQIKCVYEAIALEPDAIVLSPCSYTDMDEAAGAVGENGIKLVLIDSEVESQVQDCLINTDNYMAGEKIADYLLDIMNYDSRILIVNHVRSSSTAQKREKGIREGLGERAAQIMEVLYTDSDYDKAYQDTLAYLKEHTEIDIVVGLNEYSAVGAARAIASLESERKVQAVGFDNSIEEIQMLEKGDFGAILIQKAFNMGYIGIESAVKLCVGESVPAFVDSGCELVTKENMYTEENQKLLFPFY